ncbi:uncharacterized protein FIBRA_04297 [Fibroporia radiculosa]|uniref:Uncharacterized protein n=1 Tax=Fibroporia radiculosa TaxID=599839 RepID=J4HWG4_9APHY|nr:uncharacterized protein FIBRA_04297 [Fibroporia radiculosa]CCM02217.1 predicted protein [Fibroporia radiculosa]
MAASLLPQNYVLDLHDFAAILLDCHARIGGRFANARLTEVAKAPIPLQTLPSHILPLHYHTVTRGQSRITYILRTNPSDGERVTISTFADPSGVKTPNGNALTRRELENIFWRCKSYDNGYVLAYAAQRVFERLPSTARLRARTSSGYEIICALSDVVVAEIDIYPREACLMVVYEHCLHLGPTFINMTQHLSGFDIPMPWVYLLVGKPHSAGLERDTRKRHTSRIRPSLASDWW